VNRRRVIAGLEWGGFGVGLAVPVLLAWLLYSTTVANPLDYGVITASGWALIAGAGAIGGVVVTLFVGLVFYPSESPMSVRAVALCFAWASLTGACLVWFALGLLLAAM